MIGMIETLRNAWKIADLRKRILFTVLMLLVYRIGSHIPVPGLDPDIFSKMAEQSGSFLGFFDIVSGGAFKLASIFAMSITPYINASIIMQLLTVAVPKLEQLQKEGEEGRKIIQRWVRYGTVLLGFIQATGMYFAFGASIIGSRGLLTASFWTITLSLTAGTAFLMWLGEQITEYGIGNGISLIIFGGIVSRGPSGASTILTYYKAGSLGTGFLGIIAIIGILLVFVGLVAAVVWVNQAERRIPVQYAKRVVGRKMYGGQSTHIPIKVNLAGVIPIIFAMSIMTFPSQIVSMIAAPDTKNWFILVIKNFPGTIWYTIFYALLIIMFTFFYTVIQFNPIEIANTMKKNGGFIPGIRPGKPTSDYIARVLNRVTWFGGIFLALVTVFPNLMYFFVKVPNLWFAGTALLILVGVALETVKQIESQMLMRHYKGFL